MNFSHVEKILQGLKRGADKFGRELAGEVVKEASLKNGYAPSESEPYGVGIGGANTDQIGQGLDVENAGGDATASERETGDLWGRSSEDRRVDMMILHGVSEATADRLKGLSWRAIDSSVQKAVSSRPNSVENADYSKDRNELSKYSFSKCPECGGKVKFMQYTKDSSLWDCPKCDQTWEGTQLKNASPDHFLEPSDSRTGPESANIKCKTTGQHEMAMLKGGKWICGGCSKQIDEKTLDIENAGKKSKEYCDCQSHLESSGRDPKLPCSLCGKIRKPKTNENEDSPSLGFQSAEKSTTVNRKDDLENSGHLTPERWQFADLEQRTIWLEEVGEDINLASSDFGDLSMGVHQSLSNLLDKEEIGALSNDAGTMREAIVHQYGSELKSGSLSEACKKALSELAKSTGIDLQIILKDVRADARLLENALFTFVDESGETIVIDARNERAAWEKLAAQFGEPVEVVKTVAKLKSGMENAKLDAECPSCKLPMQMRPVGGDENSYRCGNRMCSAFRTVDGKQSSHFTNESTDLEEIAKGAYSIKHEVAEIEEEGLENSRAIGVKRGASKYGTKE